MRWCGLTLALLLASSHVVTAQAPTTPPAPAPVDPARLDLHLKAWETKLSGVETIVADCKRIELNKTFNAIEEFQGTARLMRPNLFKLDLFKKGDTQNFERYYCTGVNLYEYRPKEKLVRVYDLPKNAQGQAVLDDTYLSLLYGMKVDAAKKRFDMRLVKEDQWWIYVEILPRSAVDKQEFVKGQLVFYANPPALAHLPRRIWLEHPNGDEVTWEFPKIEANAKLDRTEFVAPAAPQGWQVIRANKQAQQAPNTPRPPVPGMAVPMQNPAQPMQVPRIAPNP